MYPRTNNILAITETMIAMRYWLDCISAPIKEDPSIAGKRAKVMIMKNRTGLIGVSPAIYTRMSLGMPGIRNKRNIVVSSFGLLIRALHFSSSFSETNFLTSGKPNSFTLAKTMIYPTVMPNVE
jgi:hypothetical protein